MNWYGFLIIINVLGISIASALLYYKYKTEKKFEMLYFSISFFLLTFSIFTDLFPAFEIMDLNNYLIFVKMIFWTSSIIYFLYASISMLKEDHKMTSAVVVYWLFSVVIGFIIFLINAESIIPIYMFLFILPTQIFLIFFYNSMYVLLKSKRIFSIPLAWAISTVFFVFFLIGYSYSAEALNFWYLINIMNSILLASGVYYMTSHDVEIWQQSMTSSEPYIPQNVLEYLTEQFDEKTAKEILIKQMEEFGVKHLALLDDAESKDFIEKFVQNVYRDKASKSKRGMIKSKLLSLLNVNMEDDVRLQKA